MARKKTSMVRPNITDRWYRADGSRTSRYGKKGRNGAPDPHRYLARWKPPHTPEQSKTLPTVEAAERWLRQQRTAFDDGSWANMNPRERGRILQRAAALLGEKAAAIAAVESLDVGKPIMFTRMIDIPTAIDMFEYYGALAAGIEGAARPTRIPAMAYTRREPIGVVAMVVPWNSQLFLSAVKIGPALAAGCTIVLKPAETTPISTIRLAELAGEVLPKGVFNVITGYGQPAGSSLVTHPDIEMVSLTGSPETGKWIAKAASDSLKRVHLELGGKAPVIVFDDVELESAMETIAATGLYNAGQDCTAATRVLAGPRIHDDFVAALGEHGVEFSGEKHHLGEEVGDARTALVLTPLHYAITRAHYQHLAWEQVPTVLPVWEACAERLRQDGWHVWTGLLQAEMYGVPQTRKRAFLLASRGGPVLPPSPTHSRYHSRTPDRFDAGVERWVSMAEALGWGLSERPAPTVTGGGTETGGAEPIAKIEERWASRPDWCYRRPSTTIVGSFKPEIVAAPGYRTTISRQNAPGSVRVTVAEAGVLQSFPADYPWQGAKGKQFLQAGNAVPPGLALHALAAASGIDRLERAA
jgi:site-specific DNA-cytosine methylase